MTGANRPYSSNLAVRFSLLLEPAAQVAGKEPLGLRMEPQSVVRLGECPLRSVLLEASLGRSAGRPARRPAAPGRAGRSAAGAVLKLSFLVVFELPPAKAADLQRNLLPAWRLTLGKKAFDKASKSFEIELEHDDVVMTTYHLI